MYFLDEKGNYETKIFSKHMSTDDGALHFFSTITVLLAIFYFFVYLKQLVLLHLAKIYINNGVLILICEGCRGSTL